MKKAHSKTSATTGQRSSVPAERIKNRKRLAKATEEYFNSLSARDAAEENAIARDLRSALECTNFDNEA